MADKQGGTMKLASFNVENMFDRAKALNGKTWAEGKPALEAHRELNTLINKASYSAADKTRMLALLKAHGLLKTDEGPLLILRRLRGKFLNRPKNAPVTVAATGRGDWIGWFELKTEPVKEVATENIARVIRAVDADILCVVEAENRTTLKLFNKNVVAAAGATVYEHVMLIDGNDERGIDVGIMTKAGYPIQMMRSHVDAIDGTGTVFSRDCAEYLITLPGGQSLWMMVNHLKSKGYGVQADNNAKRKRQASYVRQLYDAHVAAGDDLVAIVGDFNDTPDSDPLTPLLANGSSLVDVSTLPMFNDGGRPGTHGNCTASAKLDYILLSPKLAAKVTAAGIERRGMWGGKNGTLWPHFPELASEKDVASDHACVWADLNI
ncbi:MAG: endonuclease/exonuclease/phosphatase family protein [Burkholderiales bacterium]